MERPDNDRRYYRRGSHFSCDTLVSTDEMHFLPVAVQDLSSGGLQFQAAGGYDMGQKLTFLLQVQGFLSDFAVKVNGIIRRKDEHPGYVLYGVQFMDMPMDAAIRIDESIQRDRLVSGAAYEC